MAEPADHIPEPPLPEGSRLALPGRGTTFYRHLEGPAGAPTVLLLHGWTATADLNWFRLYGPLAEHFRVIAPDHHGHGSGVRNRSIFRMEHAADDAVAICRHLGINEAIVVGYSMGGSIAQLVWRRHREFTKGLVLAATAAEYAETDREHRRLQVLRAIGIGARFLPDPIRDRIADAVFLNRKRGVWQPWAVREVSNHDWATIAQAGGTLGTFKARPWLASIDVPTSVIMTTRDTTVPPRRQQVLADNIPGVRVYTVDGDHDACFAEADTFAPALLAALNHAATV
ncbi:MAG: alpha/beta fold hydrolase [Actinobacteria bacterium]|nr:alpha/beta fold hydrolase [Actinomycetota bacterium]MSY13603.1 alpha/beta fold hydrolase [Actinomycetota bacterium]MSZ05163.1 alpha/beta fold hydrolase [Actinomycetota bacterium]MTB06329.1 alpha/beta fold hydrolase [Actinomycetota bacterium]